MLKPACCNKNCALHYKVQQKQKCKYRTKMVRSRKKRVKVVSDVWMRASGRRTFAALFKMSAWIDPLLKDNSKESEDDDEKSCFIAFRCGLLVIGPTFKRHGIPF
ncbi:MAG: hypothetical protein V4607_15710 [Pseudomonadota bacterium]